MERNDFLIEENGFNISGGERQKIILARSLLKKSNYYIFDESLSEVGVREEIEIINKLFEYLSDKTVIYISHKKEIIDLFKEKYKLERRRSNDKRRRVISN
jgi:ABC-type transport system involved in cytochrome bd biosynthesis fused ATPase/permease subunit